MDNPGYSRLSEYGQAAGTRGHSEPRGRGTRLAGLLLMAGGLTDLPLSNSGMVCIHSGVTAREGGAAPHARSWRGQ